MKKLTVPVFLFSCLLMLTAAKPTDALAEEASTWYVLSRDEVNIRAEASTSSDVVGRVYAGDALTVDRTQTDRQGRTWMHCADLSCEAGEGWVFGLYLVSGEVDTTGFDGVIRANGRVAARQGVEGERRAWLRSGAAVTVYAAGGDWAVTNHGYIMTDYIDALED